MSEEKTELEKQLEARIREKLGELNYILFSAHFHGCVVSIALESGGCVYPHPTIALNHVKQLVRIDYVENQN